MPIRDHDGVRETVAEAKENRSITANHEGNRPHQSGTVSAEVLDTIGRNLREGRAIATIDEQIVVKGPFKRDGVRDKTLSREGPR